MSIASTLNSKPLESCLMFPKKALRAASEHIMKTKKKHDLPFPSSQALQQVVLPIFWKEETGLHRLV